MVFDMKRRVMGRLAAFTMLALVNAACEEQAAPQASGAQGQPPEPVATLVAQILLPTWIEQPVGSAEHPIGALTAYVRCSAVGLFDARSTVEGLSQPIDLKNSASIERLNKAIAFFNQARLKNSFYGESKDRSLDYSVQYPSLHYAADLDALRPTAISAKGEYEASDAYKARVAHLPREVKKEVSYILAHHNMFGPSIVPEFRGESFLNYDADKQTFSLKITTLERSETHVSVDYSSKPEQVSARTADFGPKETSKKDLEKLAGLKFSVPRDEAPYLHGYLVVVVHGIQTLGSDKSKDSMVPDKLDVRNICTGQTLGQAKFR